MPMANTRSISSVVMRPSAGVSLAWVIARLTSGLAQTACSRALAIRSIGKSAVPHSKLNAPELAAQRQWDSLQAPQLGANPHDRGFLLADAQRQEGHHSARG